jgi:hypothetical protein
MNLQNKEAVLIKTDGTYESVKPKNKTHFVLKELQEYVNGLIQMLPSNEQGYVLIVNEEAGCHNDSVENIRGSMYYKYGRTNKLLGDILIVKTKYLK